MIIRKRFLFKGTVQGVGFRPFLWRQARENALVGFVRNRSDGVIAEVEGSAPAIAAFLEQVKRRLPPLAYITGIGEEEIPPAGEDAFIIAESEGNVPGDLHITPDIATCEACLAEFSTPEDRRFRYPFINCTDCGPRLTIIDALPYDRSRTSMSCFPMCPSCRKEYENPADRRFHAEPNACPDCGPRLELLDNDGRSIAANDPVDRTLDLLRRGSILAVKGLGGFHLCVDGSNDGALKDLRSRKFREEKPLAVMVRDIAAASLLSEIGDVEKRLLLSPERPIVLTRRREGVPVSALVAPGMDTLGIMLPYTPLQHLLLAGDLPILVMTSANQTDEPICIGNREALRRLRGIADAFLVHNRDILVRCDDSVAMVAGDAPFLLRRSRGYAPKPITLKKSYPEVLALGPQIKETVCILKRNFAFLSPHIGDMETPEARDFFHENLALMERIAECRPALIACDLHPGYYTSRFAREMQGRDVVAVQHHHAHIVSCMAENHIEGEVIGLAMDGTGYGSDGQAWGGEFLIADEEKFDRRGHLRYLPLPGGERAVREPWRMAAALLREVFGVDWIEAARRLNLYPDGNSIPPGRKAETADEALSRLERVMNSGIQSPQTSSLGRLFDGVAALAGLRRRVSFEGQAAMELEALAKGRTDIRLPFTIRTDSSDSRTPHPGNLESRILDLLPAVRTIAEVLLASRPRAEIALAFHNLLPEAFRAMAETIRSEAGLNRVVLSGGCFQNRLLLTGCLVSLREAGFEVFHHRLVPTNDGGISLGQAVCAGAKNRKGLTR
ncbi:MAG: carbamoyltransferase HypF [Deltaproteobacteria bacterium]|nr:carbamoyltransferase HypF [Deltaproteobacteria bacterium]